MLTIRLSRIGKKKNPLYRLIISEKARDPYGKIGRASCRERVYHPV